MIYSFISSMFIKVIIQNKKKVKAEPSFKIT